jgi:hypothetical protein
MKIFTMPNLEVNVSPKMEVYASMDAAVKAIPVKAANELYKFLLTKMCRAGAHLSGKYPE